MRRCRLRWLFFGRQTGASSSTIATAVLLSAPRIPSLAFSQPSLTRTGSTGAASGTVSRWAHSSTLAAPAPGIRANRLPASGFAASRRHRPPAPLQPDPAQLGAHPVGARPLAAGRALDPAQLLERVVQADALGVGRVPHAVAPRETLTSS